MELELRDIVAVAGILIAAFGTWYKINTDIDAKIEASRANRNEELSKIRDDMGAMKTTAISRAEHDADIMNVKQEIRTFRDEVREDIRNLNTALTSRFDMMMQRLLATPTTQLGK